MISFELKFQQVLEKFYQQATLNSQKKYALKNKLKVVLTEVRKDWLLLPETEHTPPLNKKSSSNQRQKEKTVAEFSSLRLTSSKSRSNLDSNTLSVSRSKSLLSKSRDSSRDISEGESKLFNCEWVYLSVQSSHTMLFAIMSGLILTDNKFSFKYYEDKVNDYLAENDDFSELELSIIGSYWQKMGGLLAKSKIVRWQKMLRESIEKFPPKFTLLVCKIVLQSPTLSKDDLFSNLTLEKLSKELKVQLVFFTVCYGDIQQITRLGRNGPEIFIGNLSHSKQFVVANKAPEYSKDQLTLRSIKNTFSVVTTALLRDLSSEPLRKFKELGGARQEKSKAAVEHFQGKLVELISQ